MEASKLYNSPLFVSPQRGTKVICAFLVLMCFFVIPAPQRTHANAGVSSLDSYPD